MGTPIDEKPPPWHSCLLVLRAAHGNEPHSQGHAGRRIPWLLREVGVRKARLCLICPPPVPLPPPQLVSLASEVQDLHLAQRKEMASGFSKGPSLGLLPDVPSLMETLSYSYCYVGIMTGERACARPPLPGLPPCLVTLCLRSAPRVWCPLGAPASMLASAPLRASVEARL